MRWIVGDLQGCVRELEALLREVHFVKGRDELFCVGDLINRGPESLETVRLWRDLGGRSVIGNHEIYALLSRSGRWPRKKDTLGPLLAAPDADLLFAALRALPVLVHLEPHEPGPAARDVWVVHGGLDPRWTDLLAAAARLDAPVHDDDWLESEEVSAATRLRCCNAVGERSRHDRDPAQCPAGYLPWDQFYRGAATVVHGHWAWRGHHRTGRVIGLDSGCVYGGPLTAWCQEEDRIVQVPSRTPGRAL